MGYTHYYYVSKVFDVKEFAKVAADFKKMMIPLKHLGVMLADGDGKDHPVISADEIRFNGLEKCGHQRRNLGITWPSKSASGISKNGVDTTLAEIANSKWFGGAQLETRACDGDCSHETFSLQQKLETVLERGDGTTFTCEPEGKFVRWVNQDGIREKNPESEVGKYFQCTKTAYKPYDLAVTVCLVIAKHHLKEGIIVRSDGTMNNWHEAMQLCQHFLGYGLEFNLDDDADDDDDCSSSSSGDGGGVGGDNDCDCDCDSDSDTTTQSDKTVVGLTVTQFGNDGQGVPTMKKFFLKLGKEPKEETNKE